MNKDLKKLSKEALASVQGSTGKILRGPSHGGFGPISAALCGGTAMADSCVAIIHVPQHQG